MHEHIKMKTNKQSSAVLMLPQRPQRQNVSFKIFMLQCKCIGSDMYYTQHLYQSPKCQKEISDHTRTTSWKELGVCLDENLISN